MGPGQKFLTRVGSGQLFVVRVRSGWVSHLWFGFEFQKFPLKTSNFSIFFPSDQKICFGSGRKVSGLASYLLRVKSKLGSGQSPSLVYMKNNFLCTKKIEMLDFLKMKDL